MIDSVKSAMAETLALAKPYWTSDERVMAWVLISALVALQVLQVYLAAQMSYATADVFDSFDMRDFSNTVREFITFVIIFILMLIFNIFELNTKYYLIINWRKNLTFSYLGKYFQGGAFNQLELKEYELDNPDQRIAADINSFVTRTLNLSMALLSNVGTLFAFSYILWTVSGDLPLPVAGREITIPGYMFWIAVAYAALATWITHVAGRKLIPLKFKQQQVEADFRFHLTRIREHSDSIDLARGGDREHRGLMSEYSLIKSNWLQLLKYERRVLGITLGFRQLSVFFPFLAALPALMAGTIAVGGVIQLGSAFTAVVATLSWFAASYSRIAEWKASVDRIISLDAAIQEAETDLSSSKFVRFQSEDEKLCGSDLTIETPSGGILIEQQSFQIVAGQNTIITGKSGSGKSTLFRAIAGQWLWGEGSIQLPSGKLEFISQTPYLPKGDLHSVLAYPYGVGAYSTSKIVSALHKCDLSHLTDQLDETLDWARSLSGGEKQRLAMMRVLLSRPDWLFMDEATSAMDTLAERNMLEMLAKELPDTTLVSITHRERSGQSWQMEIHLDHAGKSLETVTH